MAITWAWSRTLSANSGTDTMIRTELKSKKASWPRRMPTFCSMLGKMLKQNNLLIFSQRQTQCSQVNQFWLLTVAGSSSEPRKMRLKRLITLKFKVKCMKCHRASSCVMSKTTWSSWWKTQWKSTWIQILIARTQKCRPQASARQSGACYSVNQTKLKRKKCRWLSRYKTLCRRRGWSRVSLYRLTWEGK